MTQCPDNEAVRRKSAEAPYYHRRTESFRQFEKVFFTIAPDVFTGPSEADIERREIAVGAQAGDGLERPGQWIEITLFHRDRNSGGAQIEAEAQGIVREDLSACFAPRRYRFPPEQGGTRC